MQYYPVRPVGGGGGGGHLIGGAAIRRTADTYCAKSTYVEFFQNCEYTEQFGDSGTLDSSTGRITIPDGAKIVRFTLGQYANGNSGFIYGRVRLTSATETREVSMLRFEGGTFPYVASADTGEATDAGVVIYFASSAFTLSAGELYGDVGMLEFFG